MNAVTMMKSESQSDIALLHSDLNRLVEEVQRVVVGQKSVIEGVITCLMCGGHGLLEGVPGLGKTLLIRTVAQALSLEFSRIQFTPDLMPADIIGTSVLVDRQDGGGLGKTLQYQEGPIFSNIVLADEINRSTPKTQSALLEAMAEGQVTAGGKSRPIQTPFFVLATQNPLEQEGTYPLPEAQLDRFLFKILVDFPSEDELITILDRTTGTEVSPIQAILDAPRILAMQQMIRAIPVAPSLSRYVVRMLRATHPNDAHAPELVRQFVRFGASPRGAQAILLAARVRCVMENRLSPSTDDVRYVINSALRHRVLLNFEGEAEGVSVDTILEQLAQQVPIDP